VLLSNLFSVEEKRLLLPTAAGGEKLPLLTVPWTQQKKTLIHKENQRFSWDKSL